MSLISDALKASQREKDQRATGGHSSVPLIVPLRSKPRTESSWQRSLTMGLSVVVIVGSLWALYVRLGGRTSRPTQAAMTTPPVAARIVTRTGDTARTTEPTPPPRTAAAPLRTAATPPTGAERLATSTTTAPVRVSPVTRSAAAPAIRPPAETAAAPAREPQPGGRLRIDVEQPRGYEAARLFEIGVAAHRAGDLVAARNAYERVLLLAPNDADALNNLGVLLGAQREFERAEQVLRRVVRLAPRNAAGWNNLGTILAQRGRPGEAIAAFNQALQVDPANNAARVSMAQQHLAIGSPERARELLDEVLAANPALAEAHYTLGQAYEAQKDWAGAVRSYNSFIRVAPPRLGPDVERVRKRVEMLSARVK